MDTLEDTGQQVFGAVERGKREWLSDRSWRLIEERKAIRRQVLHEVMPGAK